MSDQTGRFNDLTKRLASLKQQKARDEGALGQLMGRLKSEFSCTTLDDARKLHAKLKAKLDTESAQLEEKLQELETKISDMETVCR